MVAKKQKVARGTKRDTTRALELVQRIQERNDAIIASSHLDDEISDNAVDNRAALNDLVAILTLEDARTGKRDGRPRAKRRTARPAR